MLFMKDQVSMLHKQDLNGPWRVRWHDGQRGGSLRLADQRVIHDDDNYIDAQVPGEIHLDLWRAGLIADPYIGTNSLTARWVEETLWCYRRTFDVTPEQCAVSSWLCFDGLDLVATISLNGEVIGHHENTFYPCRIEVSGRLRPGQNILTVQLDSGLFDVADKRYEGLQATSIDSRLHKRHWLRKPQCQFGWDWATRLINVGIFKPVALEWTTAPVRIDQFVPLVTLSADLQQGTVRARLFVEGLSTSPVNAEITVTIAETSQQQSQSVEIQPGLHPYELTLAVASPALWWSVGQGLQNRYTIQAALTIAGQLIGEKSARVGFRHVRINQDPHPVSGRYFVIEVNGRPIFAKGANFVPADMIFARLDRPRYEKLVDLALEANFNFLRVWGGGLYESDDFYDLCDEKGILIWQEFIFACAKYPDYDAVFHENVKAEAIYNIRRLAEHPSLIMWCGNNEMEWGTWSWDFGKVGIIHPDYGLFHSTLPQLMAQEDPTRYYQPSSPFSPDNLPPNQDDVGDQHPWGLDGDMRSYRAMICRFPNEGGTLGPTSLATMYACLPEGQKTTTSFAWKIHDNGGAFSQGPNSANQSLVDWFGKSLKEMSVEDFAYWGGLIQSEGLREYCDNFRRRMYSSAAAVFWMYNDCWPASRSWTIVDYYLRRTPVFATVRRTFAPIHVVVAQEGDNVSVFGINDNPERFVGDLRYGVFNLAGGFQLDNHHPVELPPNASIQIASFAMQNWTRANASAAFAQLSQGDQFIAKNRLILPKFSELVWSPATVEVTVEGSTATFRSDTFAWGVCLDLDGDHPIADNFFDLYPGIPYTIPWSRREKPKILRIGNLAF
jgi:beta-mannosidase